MADTEAVTVQLSELLRHPEDLDKIPFLKSEFTRKKAAVDAQLKVGLQEQLSVTQSGINAIGDGQRTVNQIKEELMKIDKLCAESQNMIRDFPNINLVSQVHRNFTQVEAMKANIESFDSRLDELARLLSEDDKDLENQPNLLPIHYGLTQLRDIRDDAMDQIKKAADASLENTLQNVFERLEDVVNWFDEHIGQACMNLIPLVQAGNQNMVVRLAVVIDEEEKADRKIKTLQDAQREYKDLASRFKSMNNNARQIRGYKEKFLQAIELYAQQQFTQNDQKFLEEPDKLSKFMGWYFNDLFAVKEGMVELMPKKWKIFATYTNIYHKLMHDWLIARIDDPEVAPPHMLSIIDWVEKYYAKMTKLGCSPTDLNPHVLDNREQELVLEYRQVIVKSVSEWMDRMFVADRKSFLDRPPDCLDTSEHGYFRTLTLGDMWRMLREQLLVAGTSNRTDVAEGVIDAMFSALKSRQSQWQTQIDAETNRYKSTPSSADQQQDGLNSLQDYLIALANDQIASIDDPPPPSPPGYLTRFHSDLTPLVTPIYLSQKANPTIDQLRDGFVDLGTHALTAFVSLIFHIDLRPTLTDLFTPKWYTEFALKRITTTFDDYLADYRPRLHPSLQEILIEELSDTLLLHYLRAIKTNRSVKFRRADPFTEKFKDDVVTTFEFFSAHLPPPTFAEVKQKWRIVDFLVRLLECDKSQVGQVVKECKMAGYWDLQVGWVEGVLRTRDDFERAMVQGIKAAVVELGVVERGPETVLSKVK